MGHHGARACCLLMSYVLGAGSAVGQQQGTQTKGVPSMTSDDAQSPPGFGGATVSTEKPRPGATKSAGLVRYFPANCGLSIALPRRPLEADLPVSAQDKGLFRSGSDSFYTDGSLTVIATHFQTYTPTPASSIVDSFFQGLSQSKGVGNLKYSAKETARPTRTDVEATYRAGASLELEG